MYQTRCSRRARHYFPTPLVVPMTNTEDDWQSQDLIIPNHVALQLMNESNYAKVIAWGDSALQYVVMERVSSQEAETLPRMHQSR